MIQLEEEFKEKKKKRLKLMRERERENVCEGLIDEEEGIVRNFFNIKLPCGSFGFYFSSNI